MKKILSLIWLFAAESAAAAPARINPGSASLGRVDFHPLALPAETNFFFYVGNIINWVLSFVGLVAFVVVLYAGFNLLTAADNEEQAKKSRTMLAYTIGGIILIMLSYTIVTYLTGANSGIFG